MNRKFGQQVKQTIAGVLVATLASTLLVGCTKEEGNPVVKLEDNYKVYYEIFPYSFYDTNADGIGDLQGITEKLDYVNDGKDHTTDDLGCEGIWLMPIMPSTTYHKYDVVDYYNIDPEYGTLEDFKELEAACETRGIALMIDLVFNHTSSQHAWFQQAVAYLEALPEGEEPQVEACPYVAYYHFVKGKPTSGVYYQAGQSQYYYEAMFWQEMPDLNLDNPAVRGEIEAIAKFWMELGVDGFRLDAAKEFYSGNVSKNTEVLQWFTKYVQSIEADTYVVAEVWDSSAVIADMYASGIPSLFQFPLAKHDGLLSKTVNKHIPTNAAKNFGKALVKYQETYGAKNPEYIDAPFLANHDMARAAGSYVSDLNKMKMAAGMLLTLQGSPFLYYGEEIGMKSKGQKDESKRAPFRWSTTDNTGMTDGPLGMEVAEQKFPALEEQLEDENSLYRYYTRAIRMRQENPELARGTITLEEDLSGDEICVLTKTYEDSEILVVYNISDQANTVELASALGEKEVYSSVTAEVTEVVTLEGTSLQMPAYSIAILRKQ